MITVTKHGDKDPNQLREGKCYECGCEFTYTRDDCYWNRPLLSYILTCPECKKDVQLGDVFDE